MSQRTTRRAEVLAILTSYWTIFFSLPRKRNEKYITIAYLEYLPYPFFIIEKKFWDKKIINGEIYYNVITICFMKKI